MSATAIYRSLVLSIVLAQSAAQYEAYEAKDPNEAGSAGPSSTSAGMSTGGMIALGVIVGVVVIIGFTSAALFYIAKKRQWAMRETLRRSARQVVKAVKTPLTPRFPRNQRPFPRDEDDADSVSKRTKTQQRKQSDIEKDAAVTSDERPKARGWSSYFSLNRP